jgi:putative membrane protein
MIDAHIPSSNELAAQRTELADDRTSLAVTRTVMANDRTLMAWVRTSMSLISFGFTIYKFFQYLQTDRTAPEVQPLMTPRGVGLVMIGLGVGGMILATLEYRKQAASLRKRYPSYGPYHSSVAMGVATVVSGLGILGFVLVVLRQ